MRIWTTVMGQRLDGAADTRSMLLCAELIRRGHQVVMWTSAFDHIRKEWRREWLEASGGVWLQENGLEVRFMKGCGYKSNVSPRRLVDHILASRSFLRQARNLWPPDAIVASLPDHVTAAAAVSYGVAHGVATIVDVRDKWPDIFIDRVKGPAAKAAVRIALTWELARTRRALRNASAVVAMMQSMMDWGLASADRQESWRERVFYLTTAAKNFGVGAPPVPGAGRLAEAIGASKGKVIFAFIGTFNRTQHPSLILDALEILQRERPELTRKIAVIIGGDGVGAAAVETRAKEHAHVHCVGWLSSEEMSLLLAHSHVGLLVMNFSSPAFNNKSFSYLASGLPIINGAVGDLADLLESEEAGINIPAGDPSALARAIAQLADDDEIRARLTRNAQGLFVERFDRETTYRAYADHVEKIAQESAIQRSEAVRTDSV